MGVFDKASLRALFAEFMGTFFLCMFGPGAVCAAVAPGGGGALPIGYAMSFGLTVYAVASSIGDVSGAHINPAVTFSMILTGNIAVIQGILYMVVQFIGGIAGAGFLYAMTGEKNYNGGLGLNPVLPEASGFFYEMFGTMFLVFVVFNTAIWASSSHHSDIQSGVSGALAPLAIGLTVTVCHLVLGPMTGCGINPARSLGTSVYETEMWWDSISGTHFYYYFLAPFVGAALGVLPYWAMYGSCTPGSQVKPSLKPKVPSVAP